MEKSGFFNAMKVGDTWDRVYKAENFAEYFATFIGNGVFPNPSSQLQVVGTDKMQVIVRGGKAWINGFIYINTEDLVLNIDVADGVLHRVDKIVLRYDITKREIRAVVKKGEYASSPTAQDITRNADMYELGIADIRINAGTIKITQADITDLRLNKDLCGIVHGTVDQVDTTAIFNQFQSWYSTTKDNYNNDISKWTKDKKEAFEQWYTTNTKAWGNEFQEWFITIKNKLDGDVAAKLTNDVEQLKEDVKNIDVPVKSVNGKTGEIVLSAEDIEVEKGKSIKCQLADITKTQDENAKKVNASINSIEKELENYNSYASSRDENNIYRVVEYKKSDNILYMKSTLSNPDSNGHYQTNVWQFYNDVGDTIIKTITWTLTYDENGHIVSKKVSA